MNLRIIGFLIIIFLIGAYFVNFEYYSEDGIITKDTLLGVLILHNPFIFGIYLLIAVLFLTGNFFRNNRTRLRKG